MNQPLIPILFFVVEPPTFYNVVNCKALLAGRPEASLLLLCPEFLEALSVINVHGVREALGTTGS